MSCNNDHNSSFIPRISHLNIENQVKILPTGSKIPCTTSIEITIISETEEKLYHTQMVSIKLETKVSEIPQSCHKVKEYGDNPQLHKKLTTETPPSQEQDGCPCVNK